MSSSIVLRSSTNEAVTLSPHYIRYGNRILDASFIATVTVKKNRILFNNFKENTTLPTFGISFKKESEARQALNSCCEFYELNSTNPHYEEDDDYVEVFLPDAYGGIFTITPDYLKYRDRVIGTEEVRTVQVKGRRILINRFKGNHSAPTMCVHLPDKDAAHHALDTIHAVLWNVTPPSSEESSEDVKPDIVLDEDEDLNGSTSLTRAIKQMEQPADPAFLTFMTVSMFVLFFLTIFRLAVGGQSNGHFYDEL
jgi:hypothetical protein